MQPALDRRRFLQVAGAGIAGLAAREVRAEPQRPVRRIVAAGGGMFQGPDKERLLLRHVLALTGKDDPRTCFVPTAGGDQASAIVAWYESTADLPCRARHLRLINNSTNLKDLEEQILSMDAICIGGGNTLNMLAVWKAQGVDRLLRAAWERGIVLAGESAGMICWFDAGVSDSRPGPLTAVEGLGWLKGSACPHYHHKDRRASCHRLLQDGAIGDGVACDDGIALIYEDETLMRAVGADFRGGAYRVARVGGEVVEKPLPVVQLGRSP